MKHLLLTAVLLAGSLAATAQDFAEPAFRSPVVAVEFTGQRCRYCPDMTRSLVERQKEHGKENYIITALHSREDYSVMPGNHVSLYNAEAPLYAQSIEVHQGLPQLAYNTLGPKVPDNVLENIYKESDLLECSGSVFFNDKNEYVINLETRLRSNMQEFVQGTQIDILFWALENDIVAIQDDNGTWTYPSHQHIFRGSINGTWGKPYQIGSRYSASLAVPDGVGVVENSEVVVFFLDHGSKTILDAALFEVKAAADTGIEGIESAPAENPDAPMFNVMGQQIKEPYRGQIYIQNGKKYIAQ